MSWEEDSIGPDVAAAGRLVSDCISRYAASPDLEDALEASRYSSQPYSPPPKEWPPPIEVVNARELPRVLIERYNAAGGEGTALCGIFPEIRRAWASVDNSLFLWRYDKWDGQCPEYSGEEQAICAVGLAKAKPGIFVEAIQYLLVIATPVELVLLGVCCTSSVDDTDPYDELSLQPLPEYTIASDGVTMTCVACTDKGQIFLAGRDSHIYELQYSTGSGWQRRCRKVCLTGGLTDLLSRWVIPNVLKFGAVDPIVELVIDNERNILYARTQESKIQVYDLGKNGEGPPKKVTEERNLSDQRDNRYGGGRLIGRAASRLSKTSIVSIATVSTMESKWLHLVAVASDGRRMYLTTAPSNGTGGPVGGLSGLSVEFQKPSVLKLVTTRPSPSIGLGSGITLGSLSAGGRPQAESLLMKVETAYYSGGVLLLSDSSPPSTSRLIIVNRDWTLPSPTSGNFPIGGVGTTARGPRALRETVAALTVEGRTLSLADVLPPPESAAAMQASFLESCDPGNIEESSEMTRAKKLWARGELATQHILPRRRAVVFSTMGLMEIVFNRPVDILQRLLDSNAPRSLLENFFQRFGSGEAAAMCLLLAGRLTSSEENIVSNVVAEKAAEAFEDPRLVGMPRMQGASAFTNTVSSTAVGFNMGQVVQDAEPVFSGAHEGLCLCSSRLLWPVWELPVMVVKGESDNDMDIDNGIIVCRLSMDSLQILESKIRSLEQFLRSRRNQRRGMYGRVVGLGDMSGSILYGGNVNSATMDHIGGRHLLNFPIRGGEQGSIPATSNKRQRVPYNPLELTAMEVRGMECLRRLLRRSGEALLLLQLLSQHHLARLAQSLDSSTRRKLAQLTFHQLVCSDEGDQIATRLVAALMEYYIGPDGRGTVDDISVKLRDGCPSYYNESDYKFFQAVECLGRAAISLDPEEKQRLAREALDLLVKVPEAADLLAVCQRFEDLRFYEAVVELPLQKARALDPNEDAFNEQVDPNRRQAALSLREQCYEFVMNALRSLKGEPGHTKTRTEFGRPVRHTASRPMLDQASQERYIRQIVQLSVRWPDRAFHEYLYRTMIELGLENELLELAGPDLVPFLQNAGWEQSKSGNVMFKSAIPSTLLSMSNARQSVTPQQVKYLEILARYYVHKRQHALAAHVFLRLAERRQAEGGEPLTLEQRFQYLSNAVLQARTASTGVTTANATDPADSGLLELLEGKLAVLRFQMKIKEELERLSSSAETSMVIDEVPDSSGPFPPENTISEDAFAHSAREKAAEISAELKSITQLYNDYAVVFQLWEVCLEILHFSNYSGDADTGIMRETWARLLDQALRRGGVAEACSVVKRVGSKLYPGDGFSLPLDTICLHLEKAALERSASGVELVGDEDVARALLAACKGAAETVQRAYDRLLSSGTILPSPSLRVRLLRSVLTVLREWTVSALAQRMGTSATGVSLILGGMLTSEQSGAINQGLKDKIISVANRYMTEVRRLALPQTHIEPVYCGFKELEEMLLGSYTF